MAGFTRTCWSPRTSWSQRNASRLNFDILTIDIFHHFSKALSDYFVATRDLKDLVVTRVRLESLVREDRRDTEVSLVCRVFRDLR